MSRRYHFDPDGYDFPFPARTLWGHRFRTASSRDRICYFVCMAARPDRPIPSLRTATCCVALWLIVGIGPVGCATDPPPPPSPAELAGRAASTLLVLPFNIALPLPTRLESSAPLVWRMLLEHVEHVGKSVETLDARSAQTLWLESIHDVRNSGGERSFESAARVFAQRLAERFEFDALVMPSLYVQNARIGPESARWDRARQEIEYVGRSRWEIEGPQESTIQAASILVVVLDREGNEIHSRRTGLELIQHMEIHTEERQGHDKRTWMLAADDPAIEDEVRVRAAIAHALHPFLPKLRR